MSSVTTPPCTSTLCDISQETLNSIEKAYGQKLDLFSDRRKFFNSNIDAVLIGTPDEFHYQDLSDSINAGKHTFVEKPLAVNSDEVKELPTLFADATSPK